MFRPVGSTSFETLPDELHVQASKSSPMPAAVRVFWIAFLVMFGCSVLVVGLERHAGFASARWDPLSDPLMGDLVEYPGTFCLIHRSSFFDNAPPGSLPKPMFSAFAYPPFAAAVLAPVYMYAKPVATFLSLAVSWLTAALCCLHQNLTRVGLSKRTATLLPFSLMLMSFPVQRLMHQGNVELLVWICTAMGAWALFRGKDTTAAILWGFAAAIKLHPILLLVLLLPRRSFRALLYGVNTFIGASWLSLWWLGPSVRTAWRGSLLNVFNYQNQRASEWSLRELVANHSAIAWIKLAALVAHVPIAKLLLPYYGFGALIMIWAFGWRLRKMPLPNQFLAVTVCMLLCPTVSYYHTLVHIFAPLVCLVFLAVRAQQRAVPVRGLQTTMLLCIPLLLPYPFFTFPTLFLFLGLLQSVVLLLIFLCAMEFPFIALPLSVLAGCEHQRG